MDAGPGHHDRSAGPTDDEGRAITTTHSNLGRSGLQVSRACLGALNFGTEQAPCDEAEARRIVDAFLDAGHNLIDTADVYTAGQSEEIVGRAVSSRRDQVVIATKGGLPTGPGPNDGGLSRAHLVAALDASLRRLGTDHVDLYQIHAPDPRATNDELMATLDSFVRSGKVRYVGCSNFHGSSIVEAQWAAARSGGTPFVAAQMQYSLVARDVEAEIVPVCARHGLGVLAFSPLGAGLLTGKYRPGEEAPQDTRLGRLRTAGPPGSANDATSPTMRMSAFLASKMTEGNFRVVDTLRRLAAELGTTPTALAVAWVASRPMVASVVIGPRTAAQLADNLAGFELDVPAEVLAQLDEAAPGPRPVMMLARP